MRKERRQPLQNILRGTESDMIQKKEEEKDSLSKTWAKVKTGRVMEAEDRTATRTSKPSVRGGWLQTEIKWRKTFFLWRIMKIFFCKTDKSFSKWINWRQLEWSPQDCRHTHRKRFKTNQIGDICFCKWPLHTVTATKEEIQGAVSPFTCGQKIMTSVVELMPHLVSEGVLGSSYVGNKRSEVRMWVWA